MVVKSRFIDIFTVSLINFAYESAIRSTFLSRLRPLRGVKIKKSLSLENIFPDQLKVMFS